MIMIVTINNKITLNAHVCMQFLSFILQTNLSHDILLYFYRMKRCWILVCTVCVCTLSIFIGSAYFPCGNKENHGSFLFPQGVKYFFNNMNYLLIFCSFQHYKMFGKINLVLFRGNCDQVIQ